MAATNNFANHAVSRQSPATHCALVTPHNTNELGYVTRGISFAAAGDLKVTTEDGDTVTIPSGALAAGVIHPIAAKLVFATGTTATGIVAYW